jgi:tetratricopeptide (TPR) repeat protein
MKEKSVFLLIAVIVMASCSSRYEKLTEEIKQLEEKVRNQPIPDKVDGGKLMNLYIDFADAFPEDSLTPNVLFNASRLSLALNDPNRSLEILHRLISDYEDSNPIPDAYVFTGFIYETVKVDIDSARYWYELFLKDFPNHAMYEDVRASLNNLGKTPDEIVAEFMANLEQEQETTEN